MIVLDTSVLIDALAGPLGPAAATRAERLNVRLPRARGREIDLAGGQPKSRRVKSANQIEVAALVIAVLVSLAGPIPTVLSDFWSSTRLHHREAEGLR